ncbi:hypothetical protein DA803_02595 [[Mycoplasma] phocae]|uniref:Uncharacterized protein n=1 Tax=[Mycoplasma] phocae TaxID=142651 RepID=A0A2Z5ISV2_9BACT|nr:hypothetical protein [[Mycoplasma] phocae]AXE60958.1 hypothetical protein DA803_02595 [[Mycoplasma] phocae]
MIENKRKKGIKISIIVFGMIAVPTLVGMGVAVNYATTNKAKNALDKNPTPMENNDKTKLDNSKN